MRCHIQVEKEWGGADSDDSEDGATSVAKAGGTCWEAVELWRPSLSGWRPRPSLLNSIDGRNMFLWDLNESNKRG